MISAYAIVNAFQRNCPFARLTQDERDELGRLIFVAQEHWKQRAIETDHERKVSDEG